MNKMVATVAAGVYIVAPAPGGGDVVLNLSQPPSISALPDSPAAHPYWVGINGGPSTQVTFQPKPPPQNCTRTRNWSFKKMLSSVLTDECEAKANEASIQRGVAVVIGGPSS